MSDFAARAFVLALAMAATAVIGYFGVAGGERDDPPPGGRWRRFAERMRSLGEVYSGRGGNARRR